MSGDSTIAAQPLLPSDPRQLGQYQLIGRLGEGGMGTVYLARSASGRTVAVKIIRPELAHDHEFRRRFRSEVERAQEVPPFCTAEVLDADPDHAQPYLVVEYVDGPSLASVVQDRGPLTSGNLHGLAIGVATALTAIHGAGVIHRDLKPSNVLLAPGSPKVIDFGIARAVEAAGGPTRTDQMIGTVAYMAPERFDSGGGRTITPAADVFAWGAVVAYAGTGRTPFAAELPHLVAARILTQPPDLGGLAGPLRDLAEHALAKDPAARPTARELLDHLLATGPHRSGNLAAALARQPALRVAAEEARAATDHHAVGELTAFVPPVDLGARLPVDPDGRATTRFADPAAGPVRQPAAPGGQPLGGQPLGGQPPGGQPPGGQPPGGYPPGGYPPGGQAPGPGRPERRSDERSWSPVVAGVFAALAVVAVLALVGVLTGVIPINGRTDHKGGTAAPTTAAPSPPVSPSGQVLVKDPLTAALSWEERDDQGQGTTCLFNGALVVNKSTSGPYRCPGPKAILTDFNAAVDIQLLSPGSCASIWFRFEEHEAGTGRDSGYMLRTCADGFTLISHGLGDPSAMAELYAIQFADPIPLRTTTRVGLSASGGNLVLYRGGKQVGTWQDTKFDKGRLVLGIFHKSPDRPPFSVSFANIEIRKPT
jgi:eukaryotic-like serine/threonine-protein kinase